MYCWMKEKDENSFVCFFASRNTLSFFSVQIKMLFYAYRPFSLIRVCVFSI
jgi:hypothetical protein